MTPLIIIGLILIFLWTAFCVIRRKHIPPKYQLGDKVRFAYSSIGSDYVYIGKIWKIQKYWLCEPSYSIYYSFRNDTGSSYNISESNIIELIERTNKTPHNPFKPTQK